MNMTSGTDIDRAAEAEFLERLLPFVRSVRKGNRIQLVMPAAAYEREIQARLAALQDELPQAASFSTRTEAPDLD